jgi:hypothetical protein
MRGHDGEFVAGLTREIGVRRQRPLPALGDRNVEAEIGPWAASWYSRLRRSQTLSRKTRRKRLWPQCWPRAFERLTHDEAAQVVRRTCVQSGLGENISEHERNPRGLLIALLGRSRPFQVSPSPNLSIGALPVRQQTGDRQLTYRWRSAPSGESGVMIAFRQYVAGRRRLRQTIPVASLSSRCAPDGADPHPAGFAGHLLP